MIANFLDDFKTVRIFPDADGNSQFCLANQFLLRGEGVPKILLKKTGILGPKNPISYISALFGPLYDFFGPFLTLFNARGEFRFIMK